MLVVTCVLLLSILIFNVVQMGLVGSFVNLLLSYGSVYVSVFIVTLVPAVFGINMTIKSIKKHGIADKRTIALLFLTGLVWFSPSLISFVYAIMYGAHWGIYLLFGVILAVGMGAFMKKLPRETLSELQKYANGILTQIVLWMFDNMLSAVFLSPTDEHALELISKFRGQHVNWVGNTDGPPRELDVYDGQNTTTHVAVFFSVLGKKWLVGYGRLLFRCNQMLTRYQDILDKELDVTHSVEISRLVIVKEFFGFRVRGRWLSGILQLIIYRKFFQACEQKGALEWWAVLGSPLHKRLCKFGFPFERVNNLQGKDAAGVYYAVKMCIFDARAEVEKKSPLLYCWFRKAETKPVSFANLGGNESVPVSFATKPVKEPAISV
ncbi:hypothetical protein COY32_01515 [candidate division WWE3 bacterium CG_4_10_14_0_2_um_filter_41_14]|uniref:Uncharacterized protein n=1 Tax=candidate division WWE3 bacterium CG_4_10_14_0_2_um_filter_41_14 TaxID=1975072 RepID=A0A2M7TKX0_UNCKA|nr:MAG: hypothetical protein COY32_01515 [candidate division WWE3 bacterium CG_4_10_14_0_2_um_filter_41_14]